MTVYDLGQYATLRVWAEMFFDAQQGRIRVENRVRSAEVFPEVFAGEIAAARENEKRIRLALRRQYRRTAPAGVIAWQKTTTGIGPDLLAHLLGHLGHPRIATPYHWEGSGAERKLIADEPFERGVAQLWAYCGHGDPGRRPRSGMTAVDAAALGSPTLKMVVHLVAQCAIKQPGASTPDPTTANAEPLAQASGRGPLAAHHSRFDAHSGTVGGDPLDPGQSCCANQSSGAGVDPSATEPSTTTPPIRSSAPWPYRAVYDKRRLATFGRVHDAPCVRCGPSGQPALPGSPWSKAHQHADALRIVGKAILCDLWTVA